MGRPLPGVVLQPFTAGSDSRGCLRALLSYPSEFVVSALPIFFSFGMCLRFFRWSNIKRSKTSSPATFMMYRNYFTVFKRGFVKQKGYSFLNIFGLAIGISCFLLISLYIKDEYSFDRMHSKADRIYRIHEIFQSEGVGERSASQPFPVAQALLNDHPSQILKAVRVFNFQAPTLALSTIDNKKEFNESRLFFADSAFFECV